MTSPAPRSAMTTLRLEVRRFASTENAADVPPSASPPPKQHANTPLVLLLLDFPLLPTSPSASGELFPVPASASSLFIIAVATMSSDMSKSKSSSMLFRVRSSRGANPSFRVFICTLPLSITNISVPSSPCCMSKSPLSYVLTDPTDSPSMINWALNALSSVSIEVMSSRAVGSAVAVCVGSTAGSVPRLVTHAWHMISFSVALSSGFLFSTRVRRSTRSPLISPGISGSVPTMFRYTSSVVSPLKGTLPHTM
mmetsp:Transcript_1831/g.6942  ORF Transcript_1831/g.6942 Transcript_1831/m.6942 type:complete len:253 (+) Transcript_1831:471-1229(+)